MPSGGVVPCGTESGRKQNRKSGIRIPVNLLH